MSGLAGFCNFSGVSFDWKEQLRILDEMKERIKHRGEYSCKDFQSTSLLLANAFHIRYYGNDYYISLEGELYNASEIRETLLKKGYKFETETDTELVLRAYIHYGVNVVNELNGVFAFVVYDREKHSLILFRDRFGVKPLFFTFHEGTLIFASELKALFAYPQVPAILDKNSLCEIFGLGPARTEGLAVFKNMFEIKHGHFAMCAGSEFRQHKYFDLVAEPHTESYEETVEHAGDLLRDALKRQIKGDNICCFLSGGLDSSVVTSFYAENSEKQIDTFSFDFVDNDKYFQSNGFQPELDRPWVEKMMKHSKTHHTFLFCDHEDLAKNLYESVVAKDLPGMADVDSSLLYFCQEVAKTHRIALTGECSDEIFAGYPWFHKEEMLHTNGFPWSSNLDFRKQFLKDEILEKINLDAYVNARYQNALKTVPRLEGESEEDSKQREVSYLNMKWFMSTLIDRMDRASSRCGLTARVPFCDYRLVSYLYNVPYAFKCKDGVVKSILRDCAKDLLPEELLMRKKSPYPKTYNPYYTNLLADSLRDVLDDKNAPLLQLVDKQKVLDFLAKEVNVFIPWYGQLMATPQMIAYLLQINFWLAEYAIQIEL